MSNYAFGRIPRPHPWTDCRSLNQIPSLSDSERSTLKGVLPNLIQECLNPEVTLKFQNPDDVEDFTSRAIEEMPFLDRYHEAWPVLVYARESLYGRKRHPNTSKDPESANYATTIPRTSSWHAYRNIHSIPGLSADERTALMSTVQTLAPDYLDMSETWASQTEARCRRLLKDVSGRLAFLSRYDGEWPAEAYAKVWVCRQAEKHKSEKKKSRAKSLSVEIVEGSTSARPWTRPTTRVQRHHQYPLRSRMPSTCDAPSFTATLSEGSRTPLDSFLESIHPCMSSLGPVLVEGGIIDLDHLDGLAELPWEEKDDFFKTDLGLNPFQTRMLKRGLEERAGRS